MAHYSWIHRPQAFPCVAAQVILAHLSTFFPPSTNDAVLSSATVGFIQASAPTHEVTLTFIRHSLMNPHTRVTLLTLALVEHSCFSSNLQGDANLCPERLLFRPCCRIRSIRSSVHSPRECIIKSPRIRPDDHGEGEGFSLEGFMPVALQLLSDQVRGDAKRLNLLG